MCPKVQKQQQGKRKQYETTEAAFEQSCLVHPHTITLPKHYSAMITVTYTLKTCPT